MLIPRDAEETKRLKKFKARVSDLKMKVTVGKLCVASYNAGLHIKALDEWTIHCDLCECNFHCREVMRLEAVEKHVFSKEHVKLLALEKGEFTIYVSFLSLVSFFGNFVALAILKTELSLTLTEVSK